MNWQKINEALNTIGEEVATGIKDTITKVSDKYDDIVAKKVASEMKKIEPTLTDEQSVVEAKRFLYWKDKLN